jgi:mRNA interferase YafQ
MKLPQKKIEFSTKFRREFKLMLKRGKQKEKLDEVVTKLAFAEELDTKHKPHPLKGKYTGLWECHIEPDWLLIYQVFDDTVLLIRTGSHADLF